MPDAASNGFCPERFAALVARFETANRQYTKYFALGRDRVRGQAHGLQFAEIFHYVGPDEPDIGDYASKNAVPL